MKKQQMLKDRSHSALSGACKILLALMVFIISTGLVFSQKTVTGTVTGTDNAPLPGVSIVVKGTTTGTITDINGKYSLSLPSNAKTLVFTFVGMESQEIAIGSGSVYDVALSGSLVGLQEVVVIGFGKQSREVITTSVSKLDTKVLANVPYANVATALEGHLAGVRVQTISGQPGTAPRIIIRGGTSINNPNGAAPLYIIDGVIRDNMNAINSADIESIQVLKDASSTAIYGARGSNGVVIIVTKSGAAGPTQVTYKYDLSFSQVGKRYDLLNARDFVYFQRLGFVATGRNVPAYSSLPTGSGYPGGTGNDLTNLTWDSVQKLTPENQYKLQEGWQSMPDPLDPSTTLIFSDTDWQDVLFRTAVSHNHSLSVSGGNEKATFSLGMGYLDAQGIANTTDYKRISMNLHADIKVTDNIKAFGQVAYTNMNNHVVFSEGAIFKSALILPPTAKRYFEDGTLSPGQGSYGNTEYFLGTYNPLNNENDLTLVVGAQWKIIPGLTFDPRISLYQRNGYSRNFQKQFLNGPTVLNSTRSASASYAKRFDPQAEAVLTYNRSINSIHNLEVKAGFSYYENDNYSVGASGNKAATDLIPTLNASGTPVSVTGSESHQIIVGYFSRATYNFKEKYLFNASVRYDGASNLGTNSKWGLFPGVSLGWNMHKEDFWSALPENMIKLKLRASYGVNGNISGLGLYQAQGTYSTGTIYSTLAGIQNTVLPNANLQWEQSKTLDFGLDLGLFNDRVNVLFDVYRRVTDNLLTNLSMPASTGFASILTNFGSLENKGIEIEVNLRAMPSTSAFQWNISFNAADVKTKILKLPDNGVERNRIGGEYLWDPSQGKYAWLGGLQEGGAIGDYYAFKQVSVYTTDEEAAAGPIDMLVPRTDKTKYGGDVNWLDLDGNDTINVRDKVYVGNMYPHFTGGFTNSFSYKNVSLDVRMDFTLGHTINYETGGRIEGCFSGVNAIGSNILRSWQKPGDVTDVSKYYFADQNGQWNVWNGRGNSRFFPKGNFLCMREITLSYNIPKSILQKIKISDLRFNVTGNNLYYFTKYPGLNPEASGTDTAYPNPRSIIFGASITF